MAGPSWVSNGIPTVTTAVIANADTAALPANTQRRGLLIANPNAATVIVNVMPQPATGSVAATATNGIALIGGNFIFIDSLLMTCGFRAFASAGSTNLTFVEWI
jgi:hypothetical protein